MHFKDNFFYTNTNFIRNKRQNITSDKWEIKDMKFYTREVIMNNVVANTESPTG